MNDGLIHFRCPICRARMATRAANAEQHVECPECRSTLAVPYESRRTQPGMDLYADEAALEFRSPRRGDEGEVDMTPMVDVTFLLLIFFMVTAAFTMQKSFKLPAPQENAPSAQVRDSVEDAGVITVRIDEYNTFHVSASRWDEEQEAPSEQELLRRLREAKAGRRTRSSPQPLDRGSARRCDSRSRGHGHGCGDRDRHGRDHAAIGGRRQRLTGSGTEGSPRYEPKERKNMSAQDLISLLQQQKLLSRRVLDKLRQQVEESSREVTAKSLAKLLVKKGLLAQDTSQQLLQQLAARAVPRSRRGRGRAGLGPRR